MFLFGGRGFFFRLYFFRGGLLNLCGRRFGRGRFRLDFLDGRFLYGHIFRFLHGSIYYSFLNVGGFFLNFNNLFRRFYLLFLLFFRNDFLYGNCLFRNFFFNGGRCFNLFLRFRLNGGNLLPALIFALEEIFKPIESFILCGCKLYLDYVPRQLSLLFGACPFLLLVNFRLSEQPLGVLLAVVEVAGAEVPFLHLPVFGRNARTNFRAMLATGVELATLGRIYGRRYIAFKHYPLHLYVRVRHGHGGEQRLGVGVQRIVEHPVLTAVLHYIA